MAHERNICTLLVMLSVAPVLSRISYLKTQTIGDVKAMRPQKAAASQNR